MALEKLEGAVRFTAAQTVAIVEATGPSATVTVAAASSTYYLTSNASLLSAIVNALNDDATLGGTYSLSLDDDTDAATGKATLSATGVGASFSLTWNTTALRDALGWAANLSGATSYLAPAQARYLFLPNCGRSNPMAPNPGALTQDMGVEESDYTITVAPSGASKRVGYNRRLTEQLEWSWLTAHKVWIQHETITNESMQRFYRDVIAIGRAFRYHPDRSSDSVCFEWAAREGDFKPTPVVPTWVGAVSGWVLRIPVVGQTGSAGVLVLVSGAGTVTEAADTLAATGTVVTMEIVGALTVTEAGDTVAATGIVLPSLEFWCRSDQGITLVGSKISQWNDLTASARHLSQGTDARRPELVTASLDGADVARFGPGDLDRTLAWTAFNKTTTGSLVIVLRHVNAGDSQIVTDRTGAGLRTWMRYLYASSIDRPLIGDAEYSIWSGALADASIHAMHWSWDYSGGTRYGYINVDGGTEVATAFPTELSADFKSLGVNFGGSGYSLQSDIAEVRIYAAKLSAGQWTALLSELRSRYASIP